MLDVIIAKRRGTICMGDATNAISAIDGKRFALVVFCAKEFGPPPQVFDVHRRAHDPDAKRASVYHCPIDDAVLTRDEMFLASRAADLVTANFLAGREVLVTCMKGRNRSGLVVALALHMMSGCGGKAALRAVRNRRLHAEGPALVNPTFVQLLENIPSRKQAPAAVAVSTEDRPALIIGA